jgi:glycosyltransferase involved in cell wall biosynthesis
MKVAILSYPMLFQYTGGLQIQIRETAAALERLGVAVSLVNSVEERLTDYDLVHVFSAINGNHRIVECAKGLGIPVVVSPLIRPYWNRRLGWLARHLESAVGRLTHWNIKTEYRQIAACLENADSLIALGETEQRSITGAFKIRSERVRVVPNGIPARFFTSEAQTFCKHFGIEAGFVLSVASVNPHKNQLAAAKATASSSQQLVVIGPCLSADLAYLESLKALPHVIYLGPLDYDSPLLASAYAAAGVFCLPSGSEVMPLSVMESLAAGTPAVMTKNHCMDLTNMRSVVTEVEPTDESAIRNAIVSFLRQPPAKTACRESVKQFTWEAVAEQIHQCYEEVLAQKASV